MLQFLIDQFTIGWIGNVCLITGAWRLAHKCRFAFLITMLGGLCWLREAVVMGRSDWVFIEVVMLLVGARNYWHWRHDARTNLAVPTGTTED